MIHILIVDDNKNMLQALKSLTEWKQMGAMVSAVPDGERACRFLQESPLKVDILITDIKMPKMSGIELIARIRETQIPIKIIIYSAYDDFQFAKKGIEYKVDDYILKPTHLDEFLSVIERHIAALRKERQQDIANPRFLNSTERLFLLYDAVISQEILTELLSGLDAQDKAVFRDILARIEAAFRWRNTPKSEVRLAALKIMDLSLFYLHDKNRLIPGIQKQSDEIAARFTSMETHEIFATLGDWLETIADYLTLYANDKKANKIRVILDYIEAHLGDDLLLEDVAEIVRLTPNYVGSIFKDTMGLTFSRYVTLKRVEKAKQMLRNPDIKIYEVAFIVGFKNPQYFSKVFTEIVGIHPSEYKG